MEKLQMIGARFWTKIFSKCCGFYSLFQLTLSTNSETKFGSSSKVQNEIHKPACKLSIGLATLALVANQRLCLQTCL